MGETRNEFIIWDSHLSFMQRRTMNEIPIFIIDNRQVLERGNLDIHVPLIERNP